MGCPATSSRGACCVLSNLSKNPRIIGARLKWNEPTQNTITDMDEKCAICGCQLDRVAGSYARPTVEGRSGASRHHFVSERFFGRSSNRRGTKTKGIFDSCPWGHEGEFGLFCYECHEELLHNPVLLPEDIALFAELVKIHGLSESVKSEDRSKIAGRVNLFHDVVVRGLKEIFKESLGT